MKGFKASNILIRFLKNVSISANCWIWNTGKTFDGYGLFNVSNRKCTVAHRVSYSLFIGEIPEGKKVMHTCDNPECVSPFHLKIGTQKENIQDSINKGRFRETRKPISESRRIYNREYQKRYYWRNKIKNH